MKRLASLIAAIALAAIGSFAPASALGIIPAPAPQDTSYTTTIGTGTGTAGNLACSLYQPQAATSIYVSSLASGAQLTVEASTAGETPAAVPGIVGPSGQQSAVISANGTYRVNTANFHRICVAVSATATGTASVTFVSTANGQMVSLSEGVKPYINCDLTAKVDITTATTTSVISGASGKNAYICAYSFTVAGTSPTVQFEGGQTASTPCDTNTATITGAFAPTSGNTLNSPSSGYPLLDTTAISGSAPNVCIVSGGTSPAIHGFIRYGLK